VPKPKGRIDKAGTLKLWRALNLWRTCAGTAPERPMPLAPVSPLLKMPGKPWIRAERVVADSMQQSGMQDLSCGDQIRSFSVPS